MPLGAIDDQAPPGFSTRAAAFGTGIRRFGQAALGLVLPPHCLACQKPVTETGALCVDCWSGLKLIERPYCERLGTPFPADFGPGLLSPAAIAKPPTFDRARAVARFDGTARDSSTG